MKKTLARPTLSLTAFATCIAMLASSAVYADDVQNKRQHAKAPHHKMVKMNSFKQMMKKLGLTESQKKEISSIKQAAKSENEELSSQLKAFRSKEKELIRADHFDEEAYIALINEYQSTRSQLMLNRAKNKHSIRLLLSEEQKIKLDSFKEKRMNRLAL